LFLLENVVPMQSAEIALRFARPSDVPAIVGLLADDPLGRSRETVGDPLPAAYWQAFDDIAAQSGNHLLVAERTGAAPREVVGCLQLTIIPSLSRGGTKRGLIEAVRVGANSRGLGIGERLIRHAIDIARVAGCGLVQLTTDKSRLVAHRFYERLGFVATHLGMKLELE
jgi:ribosomal protein S18 acetylase RimI-like enzyme